MTNSAPLPEPVARFVAALRDNALKVEDWSTPDLKGGRCFADTVVHVSVKPDGSVTICDNYERFFSTIYTYTPDADSPDGRWTTRRMYSDEPAAPYSFEEAMADASIMFTG